MHETLKDLLDQRDHLLQDLAKAGDMRPGSISENYRKCGKPTCRCAKPEDPGHGPYYVLTRKVNNKTRTTNLRPGSALVKIQKEVETYQHFRRTCRRLFEVNERICDLRPCEESPPLADTVKKKTLQIVHQEVEREVEHLIRRILRDRERSGALDLEAVEMAVRSCMLGLGGKLLEELVNADGGDYRGPTIDCGQGHSAKFIEYRKKTVHSVLAPISVQRAYYHCATCHAGVVPKDQALDLVSTTFSPGARRLMARVGGQASFEKGQVNLEELADLRVKTKQVERISENIGEQVRSLAKKEIQAATSDQLLSLERPSRLYIAMDGTGVPIVPWQQDGRPAKDPSLKQAKTREAKLGCVFTQTACDEKGRPVRDKNSTTYVGAIETASEFGWRIYTEAVRRGLKNAKEVVVLGDGAPWIWNLAEEHFPDTIQILDLYHAREHLSDLAKIFFGSGTEEAKRWSAARFRELDQGPISHLLQAFGELPADRCELQDEVRRARNYFETNAKRMQYARFRKQGLFVGSGVIEAGCKTVVGYRLKQSGMWWTVEGANKILALCCCQLGGRWEDFWATRLAA